MARPRTDIMPRIVRAARARFLEEGVDGASLRTIARDAGTNVGMVFYYFPTKDDLFLAVVEELYVNLLRDLEQILGGKGTVRERLQRAFVRLGNLSDDEHSVVRLTVREALLSSSRFDRVFARFRAGHVGMLLGTLAEGMKSGEIDAGLPLPLVLLCTFGMGGAPQLVRRGVDGRAPFGTLPDVETLAAITTELLFRAVGPRDAPRSKKKKTKTTRAVGDDLHERTKAPRKRAKKPT